MTPDPLTLSTSLATIVGLICSFKQERGGAAAATHREFIEYLQTHRHQEVVNLIERTHSLSSQVEALLREENAVILQKLATANSLLATVVSKIDGLSGIVEALAPEAKMSDQAFGILCAFYGSDAQMMHELRMHGFIYLQLDNNQQVKVDEDRFIRDDLETLCNLGLLKPERSGKDVSYRITRAGNKVYTQSLKSV